MTYDMCHLTCDPCHVTCANFFLMTLKTAFHLRRSHNYLRQMGIVRFNMTRYHPGTWPELLVIKFKIPDSLTGNLRIMVEPFLKKAMDRLFLSTVAILKPLESKFVKLCFEKVRSCKNCVKIFVNFTNRGN